jgi:signal transduction histidine kinase
MFTEAVSGSLTVAIPVEPRILLAECRDEVEELVRGVFSSARITTAPSASPRLVAGGTAGGADYDLLVVEASDDGLDLVRFVKMSPSMCMTPVIVALEDTDDRVEAYAAGADYCIPVPADVDELAARGSALLRLAATSRAMLNSRRELTARRDWVRYLAHDLRGLLSVAISNLSFLSETVPGNDSGSKEALTDSEHELKRAVAMVNDLLDIERIEKGRLKPQIADADLGTVVRQVVADMRSLASRRTLGMVVDGTEHGEGVGFDANLIERVLRNLLSNALRYAPPRSSVYVDLERTDGEVRVSVTNLGPSIPPARRAQLFQPFVRLGPDAEQATGAGLGLAFCRLAVEAHGGTIEVTEPAGGGATFSFTLPTSPVAVPLRAAATMP